MSVAAVLSLELVGSGAAAVLEGRPIALSVVVPTFNEAGNLKELRDRIAVALGRTEWELIVVDDDSPDDTATLARTMAQSDRRVRCLHRLDRRGLTSACIEGILSSSAPLVAVIDADLQHDERLLPLMLRGLEDSAIDVVVGSRYVPGGSTGDLDRRRVRSSRTATRLSRLVLHADLADPMSGFFMIRRDAALRSIRAGMSGVGFKILLDLFASAPVPLRHIELPFRFRARASGESKLDATAAWAFVIMLLDRLLGRVVPVRFLSFALVGCAGVAVHMLVLGALFRAFDASFLTAQAAATLVAMTFNFALNNVFTYRDQRLRGWAWLGGWCSFAVACGIGSLANIGIANWLFTGRTPWALSALAGVVIGAVWNYAVTSIFTWRAAKPRIAPAQLG